MQSPLTLFSNKTFRNLWSASQMSNFGGLVQAVGASWMMTSLTSSEAMVALVQGSITLPLMLFSLTAGVLADNYDRRKIMLVAQIGMMTVSVALTLLAYSGLLTPWSLLAFTFLIGCGTALHGPSWQASMGDIVSREDLSSAVSLNSMGFNLMRSVGPAAGGAIVALAGAAMAFAVNAVSYLAIIAALFGWKAPERDRHLPPEPLGLAFAAAFRYVGMSPNILRVILRGTMFGFAAAAMQSLMPVIARDQLDGNAFTFGILLGCFGFGAVGGALANPHLRDRFRNEWISRAAFLVFAAGTVVTGISQSLPLTAVALLFSGASWVVTLSLFNVTVQLSTPRWVVGRAVALYQTGTFGGMAAGAWLWGGLSEKAGLGPTMIIAAIALVIGALVGLRLPLPEVAGLNLDPLNRFREPQLRLELRQRSGPIMVMVDYEIAQEDVPEFLALMRQRRRMRIRDGAQQWALLRDLEKPDHWTESYHVPTWQEYVRHNERRTVADVADYEKLRALHRGKGLPEVHRMIERQTVDVRDNMPLKPFPTEGVL
ncbi:MAG: MFS transporter [Pseudorhodobacter sp.]